VGTFIFFIPVSLIIFLGSKIVPILNFGMASGLLAANLI